jgi:hypothetical protein
MNYYFVTFTDEMVPNLTNAFIKINSKEFEYIDSCPINTNKKIAKLFNDAITEFISDTCKFGFEYDSSTINITSINFVHTIQSSDKPCC